MHRKTNFGNMRQEMVVAGEYSDEGFSGKNIQGRPEFQRMLHDIQCEKDGVSYVLVFKLSRFGRNAADVLSSLQLTLPSEAIAAKTQIGLKTLTGTATLGTKTISQTNMYYEGMNDGATIKIQNPWGTASIISVTDLKVPGGIPADSTADTQSLQSGVRQALLWMGYKEEPQPTEPEPTEPEVTEPKVTEPVTTEPKPTEPAPTEPKVTEPKPTEPVPTEPEVTEPKPTEPSTVVPGDTYVSDKAYHRGDTVVFNGKTYRAKWWTRGENPETSQVWELVDDGNQTAAPAAWSPFKIYTAGMQVTYKGRVYEAKWWTIGLAPGKGWWSAWKQIS